MSAADVKITMTLDDHDSKCQLSRDGDDVDTMSTPLIVWS